MSDQGGLGGPGSFCEYCGARIPSGGSYCAECGRPVDAADALPQEPQGAEAARLAAGSEAAPGLTYNTESASEAVAAVANARRPRLAYALWVLAALSGLGVALYAAVVRPEYKIAQQDLLAGTNLHPGLGNTSIALFVLTLVAGTLAWLGKPDRITGWLVGALATIASLVSLSFYFELEFRSAALGTASAFFVFLSCACVVVTVCAWVSMPSRQRTTHSYSAAVAYPPAGPYPYPPSTSGMAIASLVLGLSCGGGVLSIIFGHLARKEIRNSGGRKTGDGMALAGLILGYISVAIWVILLAVWIGLAIWAGNQPSHSYYYDY